MQHQPGAAKNRRFPPWLIRAWALGFGGMAVVTLLGPLMRMFGVEGGLVVFVMMVAAVPLMFMGFIAFLGVRDRRAWLPILGVLLLIAPPFVGMELTQASLLGPIVETSVAEAPNAPRASGFRFTDGRLRADLARGETIDIKQRRSGTSHVRFAIAPVVPPGWNATQPVHVWAVNDLRPMGDDWREPFAAGVRLLPYGTRDEAIRLVERKLGVTSSPDRVVIQWIEDPSGARRVAWLRLLGIIAVAGAGWTLLMLGAGARRRQP